MTPDQLRAIMDHLRTRVRLKPGDPAAIIAGEGLAGLLLLAGAIRLWQLRNASGAVFDSAKGWVVAGALVAFLVWFFGFMVIAGEWFAMWQSATWNGQEAAFRFYVTVLAVLIFVTQKDADLPEPGGPSSAKSSVRSRLRARWRPRRRS